jgi:hypothetical protein
MQKGRPNGRPFCIRFCRSVQAANNLLLPMDRGSAAGTIVESRKGGWGVLLIPEMLPPSHGRSNNGIALLYPALAAMAALSDPAASS